MNSVIVFARYPEAGKVKTRLSKTLGDEFAAGLYRRMAEQIFSNCLTLPREINDLHLFYDNENYNDSIKKWVPSEFSLHLQEGADLGEKMKNAFGLMFNNRYEKVIIIGTDCPGINSNFILRSFLELSQHDITIGPSNDGGYYLVGMNKFYPFLFDRIEWGSEQVLNKTINIIKKNKLKLFMLPELIDIDTEQDLKIWMSLTDDNNEINAFIDSYGIKSNKGG